MDVTRERCPLRVVDSRRVKDRGRWCLRVHREASPVEACRLKVVGYRSVDVTQEQCRLKVEQVLLVEQVPLVDLK